MFKQRLNQLTDVLDNCHYSAKTDSELFIDEQKALEMFHFLLRQVAMCGGITYVIGNGGSAGIASHFCTDLLRTLGMAASVVSDSNVLTCFANDCGYENVYKIPLLRLMRSQDLLVAISSSGTSANIIEGVRAAKSKKASVVTLSGFSEDNPLRKLGDLNFWLDSMDYGIVETGHFFLLHTVVDVFIQPEKLALGQRENRV